MSTSDMLAVPYWEVFPSAIKVSISAEKQAISLSIRGAYCEQPVFESGNPAIVTVDEQGVARLGLRPGATLIMVYESPEKMSVRHVAVEVIEPSVAAIPVWMAWEEQQ